MTLNTQEFIEKANKVHNGLYDYSKVNYLNTTTKIKIICLKHGLFQQAPRHHLSGSGCSQCKKVFSPTTQEFIEKANKVHNNLYNYSKTNYINAISKVEIICLEHGAFKQTPSHHLSHKNGCPICSGCKKYTTQEFIEKANKIHNNLYDYTHTNYTAAHKKVKIICLKHGLFEQIASDHLRGNGCQICKQRKGEKAIREYLNLNNINFKQEHMIRLKNCNFRFDFVVVKDDKPMIVEFNGIQHYTPQNFGSKKENAALDKLFDNIKRDYFKCKKLKENNVPLLVIPYWDIKRIPEILEDFFEGRQQICSQPPKIVVKYEKYRNRVISSIVPV